MEKNILNGSDIEESTEMGTETGKTHLERGQASRYGDGLAVYRDQCIDRELSGLAGLRAF